MNKKIRQFFRDHKLGKIKSIREIGAWAHGKLYHVKTNRRIRTNEFTVYELNDEIKTVRSLQDGKIY